MKTLMNVSTLETASASSPNVAEKPIPGRSPCTGVFLCLVEEAALEHPRPVLGRELDVGGREEEDLVGDPLHPAVERIREPAGEGDQPLGELRVGGLEVEDYGDAVLESVGELLRVVEAAREDEVDTRRGRPAHGPEVADAPRRGLRPQDARPPGVRLGLRVGPVVVVVPPRSSRRELPYVLALVRVGELVLGEVAVLVPVLLLGDAEVDEGAGPDV